MTIENSFLVFPGASKLSWSEPMGDAVITAVNGHNVPAGYYNAQVMLTSQIKRGAAVGVCGTSMDAR